MRSLYDKIAMTVGFFDRLPAIVSYKWRWALHWFYFYWLIELVKDSPARFVSFWSLKIQVNYCLSELAVLLGKEAREKLGKDVGTDHNFTVSDLETRWNVHYKPLLQVVWNDSPLSSLIAKFSFLVFSAQVVQTVRNLMDCLHIYCNSLVLLTRW